MDKSFEFSVEKQRNILKSEKYNLSADLYRPKTEKSLPMVLVIHGGGWTRKSGDMEWVCRELAKKGYIAINISYRLAPQDVFPAPVDDIKAALKWSRENAQDLHGDPDQVFIWGYSAGAHLALLVGLDPANKIKAIVAGGSPTDITAYPRSPLTKALMGVPYDVKPEAWKTASPLFHIEQNSPPVFMYHGQWDWIVGIDQMHAMESALQREKIEVETYTAPMQGHLSTYFFSTKSVDLGLKFIDRHLN